MDQSGWILCLNNPLPLETSDTLSISVTLQEKDGEEVLAAVEAMAAAAAAANADKGRKIRDVRELFGGKIDYMFVILNGMKILNSNRFSLK